MLFLELLIGFNESRYRFDSQDESLNLTVSLFSGFLTDYSVTLLATVLNGSSHG